jgi:hypothetical protein
MDIISINNDRFTAKDSRDIMDLMDSALNQGTFGLIKYAMNYSIFPWNWRYKEVFLF